MSFAAHSWRWGNFPAGTSMLFANAVAPIGWVAQATNDRGVKIVSSVGGATGGTDAFSTCFSSTKTTDNFTLLQTHLPSINVGNEAAHTHAAGSLTYSVTSGGSGADTRAAGSNSAETAARAVAGTSAAGSSHTHALGGSDTAFAIDLTLDLNFLAMLHCTKQ